MSVCYLRNRLPDGTQLLEITDESVTINEGVFRDPVALSVVRMLAEHVRGFHAAMRGTPMALAAENRRLRDTAVEIATAHEQALTEVRRLKDRIAELEEQA